MKSKKTRALALSLALCLTLGLAACSGGGTAPTKSSAESAGTDTGDGVAMAKPDKVFNWKFQSTENESISLYRERGEICEQIKKETNGGLVITQYSGGAIVSDAEIPASVQQGVLEMGNVYLNPLYSTVPTSQMVGITPGFIFDVGGSLEFLMGYGALEIFQQQAEENLNCYLWPELTGSVLVCTNKPVHELQDFKGLQIRSYGPLGEMYTKLGASVVNVSGNEVYSALSTGLLDAANWGAYQGGVGASLQEVTKYFVEPTMGVGCGTVNMVNKDAYNSLPEEYQAIFTKYFGNRQTSCILTSNTEEYNAKQTMLAAGMQPSELSEEAKTELRKMAMLEMEKLSKTDESCAKIYEQLQLYVQHYYGDNSLSWK